MESSGVRKSIIPYYKQGDVFERDSQYYSQFLRHGQGYGYQSGNSQIEQVPNRLTHKPAPSYEELNIARSENQILRKEINRIINDGDQEFGNTSGVVKKAYYSSSNEQMVQIRNQESQIISLQQQINRNNIKIENYKKASFDLETRIRNIQSIDGEIYKQLKSVSHRDRDLLERASAAVARGEPKEQVIAILSQLLTS